MSSSADHLVYIVRLWTYRTSALSGGRGLAYDNRGSDRRTTVQLQERCCDRGSINTSLNSIVGIGELSGGGECENGSE